MRALRTLLALAIALLTLPAAGADSGQHVGHGPASYVHQERAVGAESYACRGLSMGLVLVSNEIRWTMGGGSTACAPGQSYPAMTRIPPETIQGNAAEGYWARGVTDCTSWAFSLEPLGSATAMRYAVHDTCSGDARDTVTALLSF